MSSRPALPSPRQLRRQVQTSKAGLSREGTGRWPGALMHARSMPVHTGHRPSTGPAGPSDPGHSSHSRAPSAGPGPDRQMVPSRRDSDRRALPAHSTRTREALGRRGRVESHSEPVRRQRCQRFRSLSTASEPFRDFWFLSVGFGVVLRFRSLSASFGAFPPLSKPNRCFRSLSAAFGAFPPLSEPFRRFRSLSVAFRAFPPLSEPSLGDRCPSAFDRSAAVAATTPRVPLKTRGKRSNDQSHMSREGSSPPPPRCRFATIGFAASGDDWQSQSSSQSSQNAIRLLRRLLRRPLRRLALPDQNIRPGGGRGASAP